MAERRHCAAVAAGDRAAAAAHEQPSRPVAVPRPRHGGEWCRPQPVAHPEPERADGHRYPRPGDGERPHRRARFPHEWHQDDPHPDEIGRLEWLGFGFRFWLGFWLGFWLRFWLRFWLGFWLRFWLGFWLGYGWHAPARARAPDPAAGAAPHRQGGGWSAIRWSATGCSSAPY